MKRINKLTLILTVILTIGLLAGCGKSFDASGYVKALLDNSYKNDSTAFVEMKIGTAEEAAALYEEGLDSEMDAMLSSIELTEEQAAAYRDIFVKILAGAKYTVGEAEKQDDDSYVVTITYEQMNIFGPSITSYMTQLEEIALGWTEATTEEEMMEQIVMALKDCMEETFANVTYDEPATTTLRIELVNDTYTPNEEDVVNLEMLLFDIEEATAAME